MKKYLIALTIAAVSMAAVAGAQTIAFSQDLYVGSNGSEVANLQGWLISSGYDIPAISAGYQAKGYFGVQTKSALARYQSVVGLPPTGFFGPLTRAKLNGGGDYRGNSL